MKDFISPMKKLYKICTQTNYYEQYEVEADSYEKAVDSVMETIHYGTDDYPENVERLWYEFDHKQVLTDSRDHIGLFAIECNDIDSDDCLVSTQSCGDWREPTLEEIKNEEEANGI